MENNFTEHYQRISNTALLDILDHPDQYQPQAVEAATAELASRELSDIQLLEARQPLIEQQLVTEYAEARQEYIVDKFHRLLHAVSPVQPNLTTVEKRVRLIGIAFSGLLLYNLLASYDALWFTLTSFTDSPGEHSFVLLPFVLLISGVYGFWKRETFGWIMLTAFVVLAGADHIWFLATYFYTSISDAAISEFIYQPPVFPIFVRAAVSALTVYMLCRPEIRQQFAIEKRAMWGTIALSIGLMMLILLAITGQLF